MDQAREIIDSVPWSTVMAVAVSGYAIAVAVFLIRENRTPQSTFAWLLLLLLFPFGGLIIYVLFGRGRHAFSRQRSLTKLFAGTSLAERAKTVVADQSTRLEGFARQRPECARLASMLWATAQSPLTFGNHVEILQDAKEKYPRLLADLREATRSIHLLYYEWAADAFTEEVAEILIERAAAGVRVRILYDPFGSLLMLSRRYVRKLRTHGIDMFPFAPLYMLHTLSYRNHRKIAVIDGRIGYSGGLNMTEKHLTGPKGFTGWRDTHARVTGEAVPILQTVFATMWQNTTGESLFDAANFPLSIPPPDGGVPVQVVSAGPDSRWEAIRQSYLAMIALARHHIYMQSPFLILDTSVAEAMKTAALSGVDVRVMVAPRGAEWSPAYRAGLTYAAEMAAAGVRVLTYQGAYFHSKTVCVDSTLCSIGSANMDIRSFSINYETNLVIYDEAMTRELENDFLNDVNRCEVFTVTTYARRGRGARFIDSTLRLCAPLL